MKKFAVSAAVVLTAPALALTASADNTEDAVCFVLREHNGKIALFTEGNDDQPLAVYKTPVTSLFPGDIELLREGIRLKNRAEVSRLIADLDLNS